MDDRTGADLMVEALQEYGVTHVFGNPGTSELPVVESIGRSELEYVLGLHEDVAVGMAGGYASTRRYHAAGDDPVCPLGVVNLHIGPGTAHGLGNLYNASVAGAPLLVTAGTFGLNFEHQEPILQGDLVEMTRQFTKWSHKLQDLSALPTVLRRAVRTALTPPTGPVFLALPMDLMMESTGASPERLGGIPSAGRGDPEQLERAAELLAEPGDVVMVVGDGVARSGRGAVDAAVRLAEAVGARVHGEILICEVDFPTDHPQWVSQIPPDEGTAATLLDVDTVLFAGCSTNTSLTQHTQPIVADDTRCIHLADDVWELGKNQVADAAVLGDPGLLMEDLAGRVEDRLPDQRRRDRLDRVADMKGDIRTMMEAMFEPGEGPGMSKAAVADALEAVVPDAYLIDEGITSKVYIQESWDLKPEQYLSNKGGGLGYGLPASLGAALAERQRGSGRTVVGYVGDGSYLYYPNTLYSAVRYGLDVTVLVPDNRNYRILKDNTLEIMGGSESDYTFPGMDMDPPVDIPASARSYGAQARRVEDPEALRETLREAVNAEGPFVVDALVHD